MEQKTIEELEERKAQIATELETAEDLDALEAEARAINDELEHRREEARQAEEERKAAAELGKETRTFETEEKKMTLKEMRNSKEYIDAFANYIKTNDDKECRSLLTELAPNDGYVPVPELVEDYVRTAWQKEGIMSRVRKSYLKGVLKVGFEFSATPADWHEEGSEALDEENLVVGIVSLVPMSLKKWITISDECMDLKGEEFLRYIYDEVTYQIAQKAANSLIGMITAAPTSATVTAVAVSEVQVSALAIDSIARALSQLSDSATDPVVVINKGSYGTFKALQYSTGYGADPFEGLPVLFNSIVDSAVGATAGACVAIVGDFDKGALANFPNGEEVKFTFDPYSLAESDLVKIVGREYVGLGLVGPGCFTRIVIG